MRILCTFFNFANIFFFQLLLSIEELKSMVARLEGEAKESGSHSSQLKV